MLNVLRTTLREISGISELEIVESNGTPPADRRVIALAHTDYALSLPTNVDYRTIFHCKLLCEQVLQAQHAGDIAKQRAEMLQQDVTRILASLDHLSMNNTLAVTAFEFLDEYAHYALLHADDVLINTGIDDATLATSIMKLRQAPHFNFYVKTGELLGYRSEYFSIVIAAEQLLSDFTKDVIQIHLKLLTKLESHQRVIRLLERMNNDLEALVAERSTELMQRNAQLLEEKKKVEDINQQLQSINAKLDHQARVDPLTGVPNRRELFERMQYAITRQRHDSCLLVCDLDHFKTINDTYGHDAGDHLLRTVAATFQAGLRKTDILCRYGGDEFVIFMPEITITTARRIAERLRSQIAATPILYENEHIPLTISVGIAACTGNESIVQSFREADQNLYQAKAQGRNHVIAPPPRHHAKNA